jgi:hypothetical protein
VIMERFVLKTKRELNDSADSSENKRSKTEQFYNIPDASTSVQEPTSSANTYRQSGVPDP